MKKSIALSLLLAFFTICPVLSASAAMTEFSAKIVEKDGKNVQTGRIYVVQEKSRYQLDGSDEIVITRSDKKVIWFIHPKLRSYAEEPYSGDARPFAPRAPEMESGDLKRELVGNEFRDSYRMKKYLVTVKYSGAKGEDRYYEWYRDDFPVPVITESPDGSWSYEYTAIKRGPFDPDLFALPKHYKKVPFDELEAK